ncbi:hypothetical protein HPB51_023213 [Rhipicephalus microplus]|uniref:Uncharacterized protein n=1 Tax=Rhipicephalus microplus TaxID=6941 RepID=A0A9J6ED25_RHIMP|nr:hypothetical protein HPB51_023213 [Rhipicephalus microplus]
MDTRHEVGLTEDQRYNIFNMKFTSAILIVALAAALLAAVIAAEEITVGSGGGGTVLAYVEEFAEVAHCLTVEPDDSTDLPPVSLPVDVGPHLLPAHKKSISELINKFQDCFSSAAKDQRYNIFKMKFTSAILIVALTAALLAAVIAAEEITVGSGGGGPTQHYFYDED